jgi:hypothetical protein
MEEAGEHGMSAWMAEEDGKNAWTAEAGGCEVPPVAAVEEAALQSPGVTRRRMSFLLKFGQCRHVGV